MIQDFSCDASASSPAYVYTAFDIPEGHPLSSILIGILGSPRKKSGNRLILPVPLFDWANVHVPPSAKNDPKNSDQTDRGSNDEDPS